MKIDKIVKILQDYEDMLSDGYTFYCDPKVTLKEIAEEIMKL